MLLMSGFPQKFISQLKWKDLQIDSDGVFVSNRRDDLAGSMHDFSRDLFEDAAVYISEYYHTQCKQFGEDRVKSCLVLSLIESGKTIPAKAVSNEAKKLLLRAGIESDIFSNAHSKKEATSVNILISSYREFLRTKCGLAHDDDTYAFLTGQMLHSSTFASYESHTDPLARARLRQIMAPLSRPRKITKRITTAKEGDMTITRYRPNTSAERVRVTGFITLKPGETLSIYSRYGMEGSISPVSESNTVTEI